MKSRRLISWAIETRVCHFACITLWLVLEYIILGPYSYMETTDGLGGSIPVIIALKNEFLNHGFTYWVNHSSGGADRLSGGLSYGNSFFLLLLFLPAWLAAQIQVLVNTFISGYFTYRIARDHLKLSDQTSLFAGVAYALFRYESLGIISGFSIIPLLIWLLDTLVGQRQPKRKFAWLWVALIGLLYSYTSPMAQIVPYALPFFMLWFIIVRPQKSLYFWAYFVLFVVVVLAPQLPDIAAIMTGMTLSSRQGGAWDDIVLHSHTAYWIRQAITTLRFLAWDQPFPLVILTGLAILASFFRNERFNRVLALLLLVSSAYFILRLSFHYFDFGNMIPSSVKSMTFSRFLRFNIFCYAFTAAFGLELIPERLNRWNLVDTRTHRTWSFKTMLVVLAFGFLFYESLMVKKDHAVEWIKFGNYASIYKNDKYRKLAQMMHDQDELWRVASVRRFQNDMYTNAPLAYDLETSDNYIPVYPKIYQDYWAKLIEPLRRHETLRHLYELFVRRGMEPNLHGPKGLGEIVFSDYFRLNLLSLANTKFILSRIRLVDEDLVPIMTPRREFYTKDTDRISRNILRLEENFKGKDFFVYENKSYLPRFFIADELHTFDTPATLLDAMSKADAATLKKTAFVQKRHLKGIKSHELNVTSYNIDIKEYSPDRIKLEIQLTGQGILVVSNVFTPYWRVKINGREGEVFPVDYAFWGVFLDSDVRDVVFYYDFPYNLSQIWQ